MTWCVVNATVKEDVNENVRPMKTKKRMDGLVAVVTALSRRTPLQDRPLSPHAQRGAMTFG